MKSPSPPSLTGGPLTNLRALLCDALGCTNYDSRKDEQPASRRSKLHFCVGELTADDGGTLDGAESAMWCQREAMQSVRADARGNFAITLRLRSVTQARVGLD
jgi:hypothetical protein